MELNLRLTRFPGFGDKEVELPIPLALRIIDIGGGLARPAEQTRIVPLSAVNSLPMTAILEGLTSPNTWRTDPVRFGLGDLVASLTEYSIFDIRSTKHSKNFAVISDYYMNLNLKLGFHYNVVDAYVSPNIDDNYIYFQFMGGMAEKEKRRRRAVFIKAILEQYDFNVDVAGDLVTGRVKKRSASELGRTLVQIGRLIGYTRQLDIHMKSDAAISHYISSFFEES
jgi:pyruvate,water dikinase